MLVSGLYLLCSPAFAEWEAVARTNDSYLFYDKNRIEKNGKIITLWVKMVGHDFAIAHAYGFRQFGLEADAKKIEDEFSYSLNKYDIDCKEFKSKVLSTTVFSFNGQILSTGDGTGAKWMDITPDSIFESLTNKVCKK